MCYFCHAPIPVPTEFVSQAIGHITLLCKNTTSAISICLTIDFCVTPHPYLVTYPTAVSAQSPNCLVLCSLKWGKLEARHHEHQQLRTHSFEGYHASYWPVAGSGRRPAAEQSDITQSALGIPPGRSDMTAILPVMCLSTSHSWYTAW